MARKRASKTIRVTHATSATKVITRVTRADVGPGEQQAEENGENVARHLIDESLTGDEQRNEMYNHHESTPETREDICEPETSGNIRQFGQNEKDGGQGFYDAHEDQKSSRPDLHERRSMRC